MEPIVDTNLQLQERLAACEEQYGLHFAGHPRVTRDPDMLAALIVEVDRLCEVEDPDVAKMAAQAREVYRGEWQAIRDAHDQAGAAGRAVAQLGRRASLTMHRYNRHFAGQARPGRDLGLLAETVADLRGLEKALADLSADAAGQAQGFISVLMREQTAIVAARRQGALHHQAAGWGTAANTLLDTYQRLCLGRRQLAVRPEVLRRLAQQMDTVLEAMRAIKEHGLELEHHDEALGHLGDQLTAWQMEHAELSNLRQHAHADDLGEVLNAELDDLLNEYNAHVNAGVPQKAVLVGLCDRADELERQLRDRADLRTEWHVAADALAHLCMAHDAGQ